eukprot:1319905-Amphidinium_carterae.2
MCLSGSGSFGEVYHGVNVQTQGEMSSFVYWVGRDKTGANQDVTSAAAVRGKTLQALGWWSWCSTVALVRAASQYWHSSLVATRACYKLWNFTGSNAAKDALGKVLCDLAGEDAALLMSHVHAVPLVQVWSRGRLQHNGHRAVRAIT